MNIYQSLWTKPSLSLDRFNCRSKLDMEFYLAYSSLTLLKNLGHKVTMYTDRLGYEVLALLPYDEIINIEPEIKTIDPHFWAAMKIKSHELNDCSGMHVDYDCFLLDNYFGEVELEEICNENCDLVSQINYDKSNDSIQCVKEEIKSVLPEPLNKYIIPTDNYNISTGMLYFKNKELKDKYCEVYFNMQTYLQHTARYMNLVTDKSYGFGFNTPDLVIEQHLLHILAKEYKVRYLTTQSTIEFDSIMTGILHQGGKSKYAYLHKVLDIAKSIDIKSYKKLYNFIIYNRLSSENV